MAGVHSFPSLLRKKLPESSWAWVITALRHDPIIWEALQDENFANLLISTIKDVSHLKPSSIALLNLKVAFPDLKNLQTSSIVEMSARVYEDVFFNPNFKTIQTPFTTASLLALALADHMNRQGIDGSIQEVLYKLPSDTSIKKDVIKASFAILFGLIPEGTRIISTLLSDNHCSIGTDLAVHILLCDPAPPTSKQENLWSLIERLPISTTTGMLRRIVIHQPDLARYLASKYLDHVQSGQTNGASHLEGDPILLFIRELSAASLSSIAARDDQAISHYENATKILKNLHELILYQLVRELQAERKSTEAVETWKRYKTIESSRPSYLIVQSEMEHDQHNEGDFRSNNQEQETISPISELARAISAWKKNDSFNFRRHATNAIDIITSQIQSYQLTDFETTEIIETIPNIISCLFELSRPSDAMHAAQVLTLLSPTQPDGYFLLAQSARQAGYQDRAVEAAYLAVMLEPSEVNYRRELALCLETTGEWLLALPERIEITHPKFSPSADSEWPLGSDLFALASCALKAGDLERAEANCREIILMIDEQGPAHALLGEILFAKGDQDGAIHHLILATQQAPNLPEPWLALSRIYLQIGENDKALETLRAASQVVSYHPEIHLSLGEIYLQNGSLSEAEKTLGNAFEILFSSGTRPRTSRTGVQSPSDLIKLDQNFESRGRCALLYGLSLYKLGFREKAGKVLQQGFIAHPAYPGLAQVYGLYLIGLEDLSSALEPFAIATAVDPKNPECLIEYAQLLLKLNKTPGIAVQLLEKALSILDQSRPVKFSNDDSSIDNLDRSQKFSLNNIPENIRDIQWHNSIVYQNGYPTPEYLRSLTLALLAQAYEIEGQLSRALKTYSEALDTPLAKDDHWRITLTMGLGQTALKNNQPEVTIASLQDLKGMVTDDPEFHRTLSEAYTAMGFIDEGIASAKKAVKLAPDDVDLLSWYAEKELAVGNLQEASMILKRSVELDPDRDDLALMLGKTLISIGELDSAFEILHKISSKSSTDSKILYQTAAALSSLGKDAEAASCLENALKKAEQPDPEVLTELTFAYMKTGNYDLALKTIDRALECEPDNTDLHLRKADILIELGRHQAALAILEHARLIKPDRSEIHSRISLIFYKLGRLEEAYISAQKSIELLKEGIDLREEIQIRTLAASIARSLLDLDSAAKFLSDLEQQHPEIEELIHDVPIPVLIDFYCLAAEINLENNEEVQAARALNEVAILAGNHPRALTLKARLAYRSNDHQQAKHDLNYAIQMYQMSDQVDTDWSPDIHNTLIGIVLAAMDMDEWDLALEYIRENNDSLLHPYLSFLKIKGLVLRAEFSRLCEILDITVHKPAGEPLSQSIDNQIFDEFVRIKKYFAQSEFLSLPVHVITWEARSQVVFRPGIEAINTFKALAQCPDEIAVLLIALSQFNDSEVIHLIFMNYLNKNEGIKNDPDLLFHFALAIHLSKNGQKFIDEAIESVQAAVRDKPDYPYYHLLLARLMHARGAVPEALQAMETALSLWPEEDRWCTYAAELARIAGESSLAISYFEQAASLEPENLSYLLNLGDLYSKVGQEEQAIAVLQRAVKLAPSRVEPFLMLASIYFSGGNLPQAARAAEQAVAIANNQISPLLLRGEIALRMNNPRQAESCAEAALQIKSDDPDASHLLARALDAQGRNIEALEILERALSLTPESLPLQLEKINLLARVRSKEETLSALTALATKYPEDPKVLANLAFSLTENNNPKEALRVARLALRSPQDAFPLQKRAELHYLVGKLLHASGQLDQAIYHISEAIRYSPEDIEKYLELGKIQQESRQHLQALETYKKAIVIEPDNPQPYLQAGLALKECRDYQGAENMLRKAAELAPQDRIIHRQLAALIALNLVHNRQPLKKES